MGKFKKYQIFDLEKKLIFFTLTAAFLKLLKLNFLFIVL